jgi:diacylglycerol kinase
MEEPKPMNLRSRSTSFRYAIAGIMKLIRQEPNMRIHAVASVLVVAAGIVQSLSRWEWLGIVFAISLVWITEAVNTAIEMLCNIVCDNKYHPGVKTIKDISAGAVLLAAIASVATAVIVFLT